MQLNFFTYWFFTQHCFIPLVSWCWSWNSNTLATWCKDLTHWKTPWCWERLRAGGEGDDRGWDGWMASLTRWTWVWVDSRSWWWTGRHGVLRFMGLQRVGHDWVTELNWGSWYFISFISHWFFWWIFHLNFLWLIIVVIQKSVLKWFLIPWWSNG